MTLRDWFAGQALAGLLANPEWCGSPAVTVRETLLISDAMLQARKPTP